jgi:hypothetical protein
MLSSATFSNLHTLSVNFILPTLTYGIEHCGVLFNYLIIHLKNAPMLRVLTLGSTNLRIRDLEILHANAPNLEKLQLEEFEMDFEDENLRSVDISPAINLQSFYVGCVLYDFPEDDDMEKLSDYLTIWTQYIGKKYGNLIKFDLLYQTGLMCMMASLQLK